MFVVRAQPSAAHLPKSVILPGGAVWFGLAILDVTLLVRTSSGTARIAGLGALLLAGIAGVAAVFYYIHSTWLETDGADLRLSKWGARRLLASSQIRGFALRDVRGPGGRAKPVLVVYGEHDRSLAVFDRRLWNTDDLTKVADGLGISLHVASHVTNGVAALEREFPGSVPSWQLHGTRTALIFVFGVCVAIPVIVTAIWH
jgi:hypothetical protein